MFLKTAFEQLLSQYHPCLLLPYLIVTQLSIFLLNNIDNKQYNLIFLLIIAIGELNFQCGFG